MRTLALVLEYDGSRFHGFARQPSLPTVAGELEPALAKLFGHVVVLAVAGRTDAGVHATGQVVSCVTSSAILVQRIPKAASARLREARIAVVRAVERAPGFSARRDALARTYRYRILNRPAPSPLHALRAFHVGARLDVAAMGRAAQALVGERDFRAFSAEPPQARTVRNLMQIGVEGSGDFVDIVVTADSFLHQMVRIMVGTLVNVGRGKMQADDLVRVLESKDRRQAGFTAPPHGLYLEHVLYEPPI